MMVRKARWIAVAALAALTVAPMSLSAQEEDDREEPQTEWRYRDMADELREARRALSMFMHRRARLGIHVDMQARETDSIGAYVAAVTPGGPADEAGLKSGDLITSVDGTSLLTPRREPREDDDERSLPGVRLIEVAARLEPNDTVTIEYVRDGERQTTELVTASDSDRFTVRMNDHRPWAFTVPLRRWMDGPVRVEAPAIAMTRWFGSPLGDLELAPLNPDLGRYFGATDGEGVLVINVPDESPLGLRAGDVVLSVDGREPKGPSHLLRILRSYAPDETVEIEILRNQRRQTLTGQLDMGGDDTGRDDGGRRMERVRQ